MTRTRLNWICCTSDSVVAVAPIAFPLAGAAKVVEVPASPRVALVSIAIIIARICHFPFVSSLLAIPGFSM
jgi:hypothetical protein